jgi:hypothetical protein
MVVDDQDAGGVCGHASMLAAHARICDPAVA